MDTKLKQWGATLVVLGAVSLGLPIVGVQLRIFNLFGAYQKPAAVAAIVIGAVMWLIGTGAKGLPRGTGSAASPAAGPANTGAVPPPLPNPQTCPKCGATATPGDRFCMSCGAALPAVSVPPPIPAVPAAAAASKPKSKAKVGCLVVVVALLGLIGWFFFGPSKSATSGPRSEPALPAHMAGTLTEFPVDPQTKDPLQPTSVVSQSLNEPGSPESSAPALQTPPETLPPGLSSATISQAATGITSTTYRDPDPSSAPVNVHVLGGANVAQTTVIAQGIAQSVGAGLQGVRVQSPQGQIYEGYSVQTVTIMVYVLINRPASTIIILYTPQPQGFPAIKRLAASVGNGRGLRDYPQLINTYAALPANPPPGYVTTSVRTFSGRELQTSLRQGEAQMGKEAVAALTRLLEVVRLLIPEQGTIALYGNARREEKAILVGSYGSSRKAAVAWRTLAWTVGWGMKKISAGNINGLTIQDSTARFIIFQRGPFLAMAKVPATSSEQELVDLAAGAQF